MTIHIRINVPNRQALDASTRIPDNIRPRENDEGIQIIDLGPADRFGLFDPGRFVAGQSASFVVKHLTVVQDPSVPLGPGDLVGIVGPGLGSPVTPARRVLLDFAGFAAGAGETTGIISEGLCTPMPVDHLMFFRSAGDNGPFLIQLSLEPVRKLLQTCAEPRLRGDDDNGGGDEPDTPNSTRASRGRHRR